jgi:hypothetical protein
VILYFGQQIFPSTALPSLQRPIMEALPDSENQVSGKRVLSGTGWAQCTRLPVTKKGIEHQMNCALEQISTGTFACSCSARNLAH